MLKEIAGRLTAISVSVGLYLPIIASLITPMVWVLAAWYFSWDLLSYVVPFSGKWTGLLSMFDYTSPAELRIGICVAFRFSQVLMFCFGIFLLGYGLVTLVRARARKESFVTYGPYKWVRHPQHLGILLMLFLLAFPLETSYSHLYWPVTRIGDLISISSVLFLLFLVADLEDYWMSTKFGEGYIKYQQNTPFMLPVRIQLPPSILTNRLARGRYPRYVLATMLFWVWLALLSRCLVPAPLLYRQ